MRFKLILERQKKSGRIVTLNYHKYIASWIYQTIYKEDPFMAERMQFHYFYQNNHYKLFTFSMLESGQKTNVGNMRTLVLNNELSLSISFLDAIYAELFRQGLQHNPELMVGNSRNYLHLRVKRIELPMDPEFTDSMVFRTASPIAFSIEYGNFKEMLRPDDEMYSFMIFRDLLNKSAAFQKSRSVTPMKASINPNWKFEILSKPQHRHFQFHPRYAWHKANVDAYHYTFRIEAPKELIKVGFYSGFGTHNAKGFGFVDVVHDSKEAFISKKTRSRRERYKSG